MLEDQETALKASPIGIRTILGFLAFRSESIRALAVNRAAFWIGLLFVISAGFAREYDGEYLWAEPWHLLIPVVASLLGCLLMLVLLWPLGWRNGVQTGFFTTFVSFLTLYWLTAPLAWLYAIPVERFFSPANATVANLWMLALVATWRVLLMVWCVKTVYRCHWWVASVPVILFCDVLALLALKLVPGPIIMLMGGVRLSESEQLIGEIRLAVQLLGMLTMVIWVTAYLTLLVGRYRFEWAIGEPGKLGSRKATIPLWSLVAASLCVWWLFLPFTQSEQRLRWETEQWLLAGEVDRVAELTRAKPESLFPPHWDPPPRVGYGESEPGLLQTTLGLIEFEAAPWFVDRFRQKVEALYGDRMFRFNRYPDDELDRLIEVLEASPGMPSRSEIARLAFDRVQGQGRSLARRQDRQFCRRLIRLSKLAGCDPVVEDEAGQLVDLRDNQADGEPDEQRLKQRVNEKD